MKHFVCLSLVTLMGCSAANTDLDDPEHVAAWANSASALGVFTIAYEPLAFADGELTFDDPLCPVIDDDGTTVEIIGSCTNFRGRRWSGTAAVARRADGARDLILSGYGSSDDSDPPEATGTVAIRPLAGGDHTFEAEVTQEGGITWTMSYSGLVSGGYTGTTVWNGAGTVSRDGLLGPTGTVTATTVDQTFDPDICRSQASSGRTTIEVDGHTLVIEYDGATDCDEDNAARYSVDGEERGLVTGITCSAGPRGRTALPFLVGLAALGLLVWRRRRSQGCVRSSSHACSRRSAPPIFPTGGTIDAA